MKEGYETRTNELAGTKPIMFQNCEYLAIRFLKEHLIEKIQLGMKGKLSDEDVYFVLTVPAIWDDPAKQVVTTRPFSLPYE
jgi:hypothetical protein